MEVRLEESYELHGIVRTIRDAKTGRLLEKVTIPYGADKDEHNGEITGAQIRKLWNREE